MKKQITEEMKVHEEWYKDAKEMTLDRLPDFISHLVNDYEHDYGTICHSMVAGALATLWAMNNSPQGGITGFQAGAIMWKFIRNWTYSGNKTGLRIIDYDKFLYPQYVDQFQKVISKDIWESIQKEAKKCIEEADKEHIEYYKVMKQYKKDLTAFVEKYSDYYERKEHYDHLLAGIATEWDEYYAKKDAGFEFAPREPAEPIDLEGVVYKHWKSIVNGVVPFGYTVSEDD